MIKKNKQQKKNDTISKLASKNRDNVELVFEIRDYDRNYNGFIKLPDRLVNYPQLTLMDRLVYSALRNYTYDPKCNMRTNVRNETIADRLGIGKTTVSQSISKLQSLGIIKLKENKNRHERVIIVVRDFYEEQPEEVAWCKKKAHAANEPDWEEDDFQW